MQEESLLDHLMRYWKCLPMADAAAGSADVGPRKFRLDPVAVATKAPQDSRSF